MPCDITTMPLLGEYIYETLGNQHDPGHQISGYISWYLN